MGNKSTKLATHNESGFDEVPANLSLEEQLDFLATYYILTMDFENLRKLYKKEYCEKLVLLTSDIIDENFNHLEIDNISKRMVGGAVEDEKDEIVNNEEQNYYQPKPNFVKYDDPNLYMYNVPYGMQVQPLSPPPYYSPYQNIVQEMPYVADKDIDGELVEQSISEVAAPFVAPAVGPFVAPVVAPAVAPVAPIAAPAVAPPVAAAPAVALASNIDLDSLNLKNIVENPELKQEPEPVPLQVPELKQEPVPELKQEPVPVQELKEIDPVLNVESESDLDSDSETTQEESENKSKQKIYYINKDELEKLNMPKGEERKRICNEIAKFYIKIAHLFAAIVTTINPEYEYNDYWGNKVRKSFFQKNQIPKGVKVKVTKLNLCSKHIEQLKGEDNDEILDENAENINVKPKLCNFGLSDNDSDNDSDNEETTTLAFQPGIEELEQLYYDDDYDYKTGKFEGRSKEMQEKYRIDLDKFYKAFTGDTELPPDLEKFGQIKMKKYENGKICKKIKHNQKEKEEEEKQEAQKGGENTNTDDLNDSHSDSDLELESDSQNNKDKLGEYRSSNHNSLFVKYAQNLRKMISFVNDKQSNLINIIDDLFVVYNDPVTGKKHIRINPELNMSSLDNIITTAREIIVELYLTCQQDYEEGIKIYEAIVESLAIKMVEKQINNLENLKEELINFNDFSKPNE